jgi:hypothetical protein
LLNQNKGYWLLFNALFATLTIIGTMRREYAHQVLLLLPLQFGQFDQEIEILYGRMDKIINVLCYFWGFCINLFSR